MIRTLMELIRARLAIPRAARNRRAFDEGVAHERRRVLHLLETMLPNSDPAAKPLGAVLVDDTGRVPDDVAAAFIASLERHHSVGWTLAWTEGWIAAKDQAEALVCQRPMPQSYYDGPPEPIR